jgi:hypothetical protein
MSVKPSIPDAQSIPDYIEDGARIAAILLVWSVIGAFVAWVGRDLVRVGDLFNTVGLGGVFVLTGFLNAVLFICYRVVDYWHTR